MGIPDHLTCLLRNLYAGQEATVMTGHGTTDWFQIGKGVHQGYILSPCLFNLYAEYIMRNAGLEEAQAGIKIAGRNIRNLRYADDTTLMAESEEEVKYLLMKVKEEREKVGLKLNFFTLLLHFHQEAFYFLFTFCHKGGIICISEVIDISPGNLDFSLCFIQPSISHDVFCIQVK